MSLWAALRDLRYALPGWLGARLPSPDAAALGGALARKGLLLSFGYFGGDGDGPDQVEAANLSLCAAMGGSAALLAVKAPQLGFDNARLRRIAQGGLPLVLDAHAPALADATHAAMEDLSSQGFDAGCAIPARWARSGADAARFADAPLRLRLVKGEWADPAADDPSRYLALAQGLAGRAAPVAVATHDPALAGRALEALLRGGTPCELEQLRGLPRARTMDMARDLGVNVRVYLPFGPGWWPYAIDKALARPYLPVWYMRDLLRV